MRWRVNLGTGLVISIVRRVPRALRIMPPHTYQIDEERGMKKVKTEKGEMV